MNDVLILTAPFSLLDAIEFVRVFVYLTEVVGHFCRVSGDTTTIGGIVDTPAEIFATLLTDVVADNDVILVNPVDLMFPNVFIGKRLNHCCSPSFFCSSS